MHLLEFCDEFCGRFCSRWPPHIWLFSWRGICCKYLQVRKSCLDIFVSPHSVCLSYLKMIVYFTELGVLDFFWDGHNSPFLWIVLAQICRACYKIFRLGLKLPSLFPFLFYFSWIPCLSFSCWTRAVSFLVLLAYSDTKALVTRFKC